jgi:hypothetical protein
MMSYIIMLLIGAATLGIDGRIMNKKIYTNTPPFRVFLLKITNNSPIKKSNIY